MPQINFEIGQKETTAKDYAIIAIVLEAVISLLTRILKTDRKKVIALLDEWQRSHYPKWMNSIIDHRKLNDYFIHTSELVSARVERDVDRAVAAYEAEVGTQEDIEIAPGTFYEEEADGSKAQDLLGGAMGISADWKNNKGI